MRSVRLTFVGLLLVATVARGDEATPVKPKPFLGSFTVPTARRAEIIAFLKAEGYAGAFVPDGAAPETLLYRGPRADYDAAQRLLWKKLEDAQSGLNRAQAGDKAVRPRLVPVPAPRRGQTDDEIFGQLGLSAKQQEELAVIRKELAEATAAMHRLPAGHIEEGMRINARWRAGLKAVLTAEQHHRYLVYWGAAPADAPKLDAKAAPSPLHGTWQVTAMTFDGLEVPMDVAAKFTFTFADGQAATRGRLAMHGDTFLPVAGSDSYSVKLGTDGKLKTIDLVPAKGRTILGIYEREGDTLKLCLGYAGQRPTEFASKPNTGVALDVCKLSRK